MSPKTEKIREAMYELGYQLTAGVHTYSNCLTEGCDELARGGTSCAKCATTRLAEVSTPLFASKVAAIMKIRMQVQDEIDSLYEEVRNGRFE